MKEVGKGVGTARRWSARKLNDQFAVHLSRLCGVQAREDMDGQTTASFALMERYKILEIYVQEMSKMLTSIQSC